MTSSDDSLKALLRLGMPIFGAAAEYTSETLDPERLELADRSVESCIQSERGTAGRTAPNGFMRRGSHGEPYTTPSTCSR